MTRHENILSFDEARARGSVSSRSPQARASQTRSIPQQNTQAGAPSLSGAMRNPTVAQQGRTVASRSSHAAQGARTPAPNAHTAYRSAQPFRAAQRTTQQSRPASVSTRQPQRLTYDPSFERSFTATPRSGSYHTAQRSVVGTHAHTMQATQSSARRAHMPQRAQAYSQASTFGQGAYQGASASSAHAMQGSGQQPRVAAPLEEEALDNASQQTVDRKSDKKSLAHRVRSAKAERQFNKRFGSDEPVKPGPDQSSRPALYEMKMGKSHKRSTRMQNTGKSKKSSGILGHLGSVFSLFDPRSPRFSSRALITCAAAVLTVVMLYQPVANYYQEVRQQQQLEAEYAVVADYYSNLKSEVEYLNTKEGLEEFVREELGWVKAGEQVATVEGLEPRDGTEKKGSITADLSNAVPTPVTWYSPVLDVLLGYNKP